MLLGDNFLGVQHIGIPVTDIAGAKEWYLKKMAGSLLHEASVPTDDGDVLVSFIGIRDITIELYQLVGEAVAEVGRRSHGNIDHLAIDVVDTDAAIQLLRGEGVAFDPSTPGTAVELDMFWSQGVRYVFALGPTGEKIELNQRLDLDPSRRESNMNGWSHLGIPVSDLDRSITYYSQFGFNQVMLAEIPQDDEAVRVAMLERGDFLLEAYQLVAEDLEEVRTRSDGHIDHIAFGVRDCDQAFGEVRSAGLKTLEDAPVHLPFWEKGVKYFNVRGPDGEKLEFNEKIR